MYFDVSEDKIIDSLAIPAANLGIDLVVLDDGWFGERDDSRSSLVRATRRRVGRVGERPRPSLPRNGSQGVVAPAFIGRGFRGTGTPTRSSSRMESRAWPTASTHWACSLASGWSPR